MINKIKTTIFLTLAISMWLMLCASARGVSQSAPVPGRFIVKLSNRANPSALSRDLDRGHQMSRAFRGTARVPLNQTGEWERFYVFQSSDKSMTARDVVDLLGSGNVEFVEPDYTIEFYELPSDSLFSNQWYLHNTGQEYLGIERVSGDENDLLVLKSGTAGADVRLVQYYADPPAEHTRVIVAIVDTGVDSGHPDLQGRLWNNPDEIADNGLDDDHNGYIDDIIGWDVSGDSLNEDLISFPDNDPNDLIGHGTHIAGIVAATSDTKGISGVAPNCQIMAISINPIRTIQTLVEGIIYAVHNGARIINASWGLPYSVQTLEEALRFARDNGVFVAVAAGNTGDNYFDYPVAYDFSFVVAGGNSDGYIADFSTRGSAVDIVAPGLDILSLRAEGTDMYASGGEPEVRIIGDDGLYYLADGTSMAAPMVAGAAALLWSLRPDLSLEDMEQLLLDGATDMVDPLNDGRYLPGPDTISGYGYLNIDGCISLLQPEGIFLVNPVARQRFTEDLPVKVGTAGGYEGSWELSYSISDDPYEWQSLASGGFIPVDSILLVVTDEIPDGLVHLRLTDKYGSSSVVSFYRVANSRVEITWPVADDGFKYGIDIRGYAHGPDFDSLSLEALMNGTTVPITVSTLEYFDSTIFFWTFYGADTGACVIRLTGHFGLTDIVDEVAIRIESAFTPGWPVNLVDYGSVTPVVADLNHDGSKEIIAGTKGGLFVLNADGSYHSGFPVLFMTDARCVPAIYDVDRDGEDEIICTAVDGIHVFNYDGSYAEGWPRECYTGLTEMQFGYPAPMVTRLGMWEDSAIVIVNLDGEILAYEFNGDPYFYSLGGLFATFGVADIAQEKGGSTGPCLASADLDGDGLREVAASYQSLNPFSGLALFDGRTGEPAYDLEEPLIESMWTVSGTVLADLDGDSLPEVISSGDDENAVPTLWVKTNGTQDRPGWPITLNEISNYWSGNYPVAADLDRDGVMEILITYWVMDFSYLFIFRADGTPYAQLDGHPYGVAYHANVMLSTPVVANITGDEYPEILIRSGYMFYATGPERVHILDNLARPVFTLTTPAETHYVSFSYATPLVADVDSDGLVEVLLLSDNKDLVIWDFDAPYADEHQGRFLRDNLNSNVYWSEYTATGVDDGPRTTPSAVSLSQNYPNPFNPLTTIRFELPRRTYVRLELYNILGRKVSTLSEGEMPAGVHSIEFDGSEFASGVYLYRLQTDRVTVSKKMIMVK